MGNNSELQKTDPRDYYYGREARAQCELVRYCTFIATYIVGAMFAGLCFATVIYAESLRPGDIRFGLVAGGVVAGLALVAVVLFFVSNHVVEAKRKGATVETPFIERVLF